MVGSGTTTYTASASSDTYADVILNSAAITITDLNVPEADPEIEAEVVKQQRELKRKEKERQQWKAIQREHNSRKGVR